MNAAILLLRKQKLRKANITQLDSGVDGTRFQTNQNYI